MAGIKSRYEESSLAREILAKAARTLANTKHERKNQHPKNSHRRVMASHPLVSVVVSVVHQAAPRKVGLFRACVESFLVGTLTAQNGPRSRDENLKIKPEGPGLRVLEIQPNHVVEACTAPPAHLPKSGNARLHFKDAPTMPDVVDGIFIGDWRSRANK